MHAGNLIYDSCDRQSGVVASSRPSVRALQLNGSIKPLIFTFPKLWAECSVSPAVLLYCSYWCLKPYICLLWDFSKYKHFQKPKSHWLDTDSWVQQQNSLTKKQIMCVRNYFESVQLVQRYSLIFGCNLLLLPFSHIIGVFCAFFAVSDTKIMSNI